MSIAIRSTLLVIVTILAFQLNVQTLHADPVLKFIGDYIFGKVADYGWDKGTGKPDIQEIDRRPKEVESKPTQTDPAFTQSRLPFFLSDPNTSCHC